MVGPALALSTRKFPVLTERPTFALQFLRKNFLIVALQWKVFIVFLSDCFDLRFVLLQHFDSKFSNTGQKFESIRKHSIMAKVSKELFTPRKVAGWFPWRLNRCKIDHKTIEAAANWKQLIFMWEHRLAKSTCLSVFASVDSLLLSQTYWVNTVAGEWANNWPLQLIE